jgi:hypothetical protein
VFQKLPDVLFATIRGNLRPQQETGILVYGGNQLFFYEWDRTITWKQEREADDCAAHILMSEEVLNKLRYESTWDLAEYFGVPEPLVVLRLTEFATDRELPWRP